MGFHEALLPLSFIAMYDELRNTRLTLADVHFPPLGAFILWLLSSLATLLIVFFAKYI
jgi:hypothetical protein